MQTTTFLPQFDLQSSADRYSKAEQQFISLLELENLDDRLDEQAEAVQQFDQVLQQALAAAYGDCSEVAAHRFLQRVLYRINRLKFFWYDNLRQYTNERSVYLNQIRDRIETVWQPWELAQFDLDAVQQLDVKQALRERVEYDLEPPLTENRQYLRQEMTLAGYRQLLAIASLDGLVESSRLCHILGGASNEIHCTLIRVLLEEYGNGRFSRKHSTFFAQMMTELGLNPEPEAYLDQVPWEVLASINHNFLLTQCKRHILRYLGGFTYFEVAGPNTYRDYLTAAQRLGLSDEAMGYWELHIREDERHGRWMLEDVALPLVDRYPQDAWELVLGYDQEKWMGDRAGDGVIQVLRQQK